MDLVEAQTFIIDVHVVTGQLVHSKVEHRWMEVKFNFSMVYGYNDQSMRMVEWTD